MLLFLVITAAKASTEGLLMAERASTGAAMRRRQRRLRQFLRHERLSDEGGSGGWSTCSTTPREARRRPVTGGFSSLTPPKRSSVGDGRHLSRCGLRKIPLHNVSQFAETIVLVQILDDEVPQPPSRRWRFQRIRYGIVSCRKELLNCR